MLEKFDVPAVRTMGYYIVKRKWTRGTSEGISILMDNNEFITKDSREVARCLEHYKDPLCKLGFDYYSEFAFRIAHSKYDVDAQYYIGTCESKPEYEIFVEFKPVLEFAGKVHEMPEIKYDYTEADLTY
ncbi:hypothetical protein 015DV002_52 [Bacillus phage 015DV002]|nr:hypothetical protein 015DV002_52 [Bacillus phage 015DV002]